MAVRALQRPPRRRYEIPRRRVGYVEHDGHTIGKTVHGEAPRRIHIPRRERRQDRSAWQVLHRPSNPPTSLTATDAASECTHEDGDPDNHAPTIRRFGS